MKVYIKEEQLKEILQNEPSKDTVSFEIVQYKQCENCGADYIPTSELNKGRCKQCTEMLKVFY